jgi:hypothetical protein
VVIRRCPAGSTTARWPEPGSEPDRLGTSTPKRSATNFSCEVWSKVSLAMWPPRLKGEITGQGTLTPSPSGPLIPRSSDEAPGSRVDDGVAVRYPPGVPAGAVGGGTWSNQPSFSSYIKNKAVFDHSSGLDVRASRTMDVKCMAIVRRGRRVLVEPERSYDPRDAGQRTRVDIGEEIGGKGREDMATVTFRTMKTASNHGGHLRAPPFMVRENQDKVR